MKPLLAFLQTVEIITHNYFNFLLVYVDISDACNALTFNLGQSGVGTTVPTRAWSIKVSIAKFESQVKSIAQVP